jgi:hypothetical protein
MHISQKQATCPLVTSQVQQRHKSRPPPPSPSAPPSLSSGRPEVLRRWAAEQGLAPHTACRLLRGVKRPPPTVESSELGACTRHMAAKAKALYQGHCRGERC